MLDLLDAGLPAPARGVFTTRTGGVSAAPWASLNLAEHVEDDPAAVQANRRRLVEALGGVRPVFAEQVHGCTVTAVEEVPAGALPQTDALVTTQRGVALAVLGADCLPVLVAGAGVVGAAHVGRRGLQRGVLDALVEAMASRGADDLTAVIGPGICGGCYEVPAEMADEVDHAAPGSRCSTRAGTAGLDLATGARAQLERLRVDVAADVGGCTFEQPERLYSFRRDGVTGRHGGLVWLP